MVNLQKRRSTLLELLISDLGVIGAAELEFSPGFTAITGETGAGKTMLLNAIGAIMGEKLNVSLIKIGSTRATVSAVFGIDDELKAEFEAEGFAPKASELQVSRSLSENGRSKYLIEGMLASEAAARVASLIQVTAQSSTLKLAKPAVQRELLDRYAGLFDEILPSYQDSYRLLRELEAKLISLSVQDAQREAEVASISKFLEDFAELAPELGEFARIESELSRAENLNDLAAILQSIENLLQGDEQQSGILDLSAKLEEELNKLVRLDSAQNLLGSKGEDLIWSLKDLSLEIHRYQAELELDPNRLDQLNERKRDLVRFLKIHSHLLSREQVGAGNEGLDNLISNLPALQALLSELSGGEAAIATIAAEIDKTLKLVQSQAQAISSARMETARALTAEINGELAALSMPAARVQIEVKASDFSSPRLDSFGGDAVELLFAGHVDQDGNGRFGPVGKVASGGELSRLMLAIEVVVAAKSAGGTYIFDEIDAGVGGQAGFEVGRRLSALAKHSQVIVVTHLAQVAVWADANLVVSKELGSSQVRSVSGPALVQEVARLLSGQSDSERALAHAEELIALARGQ